MSNSCLKAYDGEGVEFPAFLCPTLFREPHPNLSIRRLPAKALDAEPLCAEPSPISRTVALPIRIPKMHGSREDCARFSLVELF